MGRFKQEIYIVAGLRTPFGRGGGALADHNAISLSVPVVQAMARQVDAGRPDLVIWGNVIPSLGWSNIAREVWLDAKLDPTVPALSVVLACASSMTAALAAAGMIGPGVDVVVAGGAEVMSQPPIGLTAATSDRLRRLLASHPKDIQTALSNLNSDDFILPAKGWANRITGRTMGSHMEETAQQWEVTRQAQDSWAYESHTRAARAWAAGFFDDLICPLPELAADSTLRPDTTMERLATLSPAFDRTSGRGTITAGNSSPITDGAAAVWVTSALGRKRLPPHTATAKLMDFEIAAVDHTRDGLLMAPSFAIPRLLNRHGLTYEDIALWEIHEAFAAQVLCNIAALEKPGWVAGRTGIAREFGRFPWQRVNPNGGSIAIGHPFAATGARDLSQAVKALSLMPKGSKAIISICADGGEGTVVLLENE